MTNEKTVYCVWPNGNTSEMGESAAEIHAKRKQCALYTDFGKALAAGEMIKRGAVREVVQKQTQERNVPGTENPNKRDQEKAKQAEKEFANATKDAIPA